MSPKTSKATAPRVKRSKSKPPKVRDPLGTMPWRPSKYDPAFCQMMIDYAHDPMGSSNGFAALIGVSRDILYDWGRAYPEFRHAMKTAREINEAAMVKLGLNGVKGKTRPGAWQAAWVFMMKARHGWREEHFETGDDEEDEVDFRFKRD